MIAMLDVIYLLGNSKSALHWERILDWLHGSAAALPLYLLLTYLQRCHLIEVAPEVLHELSCRQRSLGKLGLFMMHALIDRYLVDGRSPGPILSPRNLPLLWNTLLFPGPPWRNLLLLPWYLLPSWVGIRAQLARLHAYTDLRRYQRLTKLLVYPLGHSQHSKVSYGFAQGRDTSLLQDDRQFC